MPAQEKAICYLKTSAATRFVFPSTQSGCRAKRNASADSWRTKLQNRPNRAADKAKARDVPLDHELPSSPQAKLRPVCSKRLRREEQLQFPSAPNPSPRGSRESRKGSQKSTHSRNGPWAANSAWFAPSATGFATYVETSPGSPRDRSHNLKARRGSLPLPSGCRSRNHRQCNPAAPYSHQRSPVNPCASRSSAPGQTSYLEQVRSE